MVTLNEFRKGMQHLAATVGVIAAAHQGERAGLTATAISSVSDAPPSLLICVNKKSYTLQLIEKSRRFSVNLLGKHQIEISNVFSKKTTDPEAKFQHSKWIAGQHGTPILADAMTTFVCKLDRSFDTSTHTIFIGLIEAIHIKEQAPLIYGKKGYKTLTEIV